MTPDSSETDPTVNSLLHRPQAGCINQQSTGALEITVNQCTIPASQALSEFLTTTAPVTASEVAKRINGPVARELVSDFAATLSAFEYLLTDSRTPGLDETARFYPNPILTRGADITAILRCADSQADIEQAIDRHKRQLTTLRTDTGFQSATAYHNALTAAKPETPAMTSHRKQQLRQWILTEEQQETLAIAGESFTRLTGELYALADSHDFLPAATTPPEIDRDRYLTPPEPPI